MFKREIVKEKPFRFIRRRFYAIIIRENDTVKILKIKNNKDSFVYNNAVYNVTKPLTSDNAQKIIIYFENIPNPVSYSIIEKEEITKKYIDLDGKEKKSTVSKIKGLNFDGKILNMFANRKFAQVFTSFEDSKLLFIIMITCLINVIVSVACIIANYYWVGR